MSELANGVIETSTGDLLRAGFCNFSTDGKFNSLTETIRSDVPVPFYVRGKKHAPTFHRWNGSVWVEISPNPPLQEP